MGWHRAHRSSTCVCSGGRELIAWVLGGSGGCIEPHRLRGLAAGRLSGPGDEAKLRWRAELIGVGLGARRRGDGVGDGYVEYGEVRGLFYRAGGWEGRQCGEGNDRRWSVPLMAFKPSVLGGERRRSSGTQFRAEEVTGGHGGVAAHWRLVAMWRHREEEDVAEATGAGRLHSGKADAAPGVGGTQAGWADKGREEA
jgi:hypothetical protein